MVRITLARPIKEDLYSILFSNEIKQTTKHKMMQVDSEGRAFAWHVTPRAPTR